MRATAHEPRSVVHDGDRAVAAIRVIHEMFDATPGDESAAWARLHARRQRRRHVWPLLLLGAAAGAGAIAVVLALRADEGSVPAAPASIATAHVPSPVVEQLPAAESARRRQLGAARRAARAPARRRARRLARDPPSAGHLVLENGTLEVDARARRGARRLAARRRIRRPLQGEHAARPHRSGGGQGPGGGWSPVRRLAVVVAGSAGAGRPRPRTSPSQPRGARPPAR